jgi:hypothetical protein
MKAAVMTGKRAARKGDPSENIAQAQYWQSIKNKYLAAGLCNGCAGQAAYGHQLGFSRVHDPCSACRGIQVPVSLTYRHGGWGQLWLDDHFVKDVG